MDPEALLSSCPADRYEILTLLDGAGKSCVYKAKDRTTEKIVGIKFPFPDTTHSEESNKTFIARAKAAASLSHPGLSPILDYGVSADGKPFVVTEFVEGQSLIDLLNRSGRLKVSRALNIFSQLAHLLHYLHGAGVVHGDIKPSYVLVNQEAGGRKETVRFTDIGLARTLVPSLETSGAYEHFLYVSPEQCKSQPLDARSDVYSMGCLMYEVLTGLPPFISRNPQEILQMHSIDEPKPMREARSDLSIPFELDLLVLKALRKDPAKRHQTMGELADDLHHVQGLVKAEADEQPSSHAHLANLHGPAQWPGGASEFPLAIKVKMAIPIVVGVLILAFSSVFAVMFSGQLAHRKSQDERQWENFEAQGQQAVEAESWPSAETSYLEAVKIAEKFGSNDRRLLISLRKLQDVYLTEGKSTEADAIEERMRVLLGVSDSNKEASDTGK